MFNLGAIAGESPGDDPRWTHALGPRSWRRASRSTNSAGSIRIWSLVSGSVPVVVEQLGAVEMRILITDQPIETGTVAGTSRFEQGVNGRSDQAESSFEAPPILARSA